MSSAMLLAAPLATAATPAAPELASIDWCANAAAAANAPGRCADSGFDPTRDGFSFPNYGATLPKGGNPVDLTPTEMVYLFGSGNKVCSNAGASGNNCSLTPDAQNWMDKENVRVRGGHCHGFSALALAYKKKQLPSASPTHDLQIAGSPDLQRTLAYAWSFQLLYEVSQKRYGDSSKYNKSDATSPNQILDKLIQVLKPDSANPQNDETYTLGMYRRTETGELKGGHAITPYAVLKDSADLTNKKYTVLAYDNNRPDEVRKVYFDAGANTFEYNAQLNPTLPEQPYTGGQFTANLILVPTTPAFSDTPGPYSSGTPRKAVFDRSQFYSGTAPSPVDTSTGDFDNIDLVGGNLDEHAHLTIDDGNPAHQVGYVNGAMVNNFPGATYQVSTAFDDYNQSVEPTYTVPGTVKNVVIDGRALHQTTTQSLGMQGDGQSVGIDNLPIQPGQYDVLRLNNDINDLTFTSNKAITGNQSATSPTLRIGANNPDMDPDLRLKVLSSTAGNTLRITLNPTNRTMTLRASASGVYQFSGTDKTPTGDHQLPTRTVSLAGNNPVTVSYNY